RIQLLLATATFAGLLSAASGARSAESDCNAIGKAKFVCISESAEDIVAIPNSDWVVISGTLRAVNTKTHQEFDLFATDEKFDKAVYSTCPGPIGGKEAEDKKYRAGGINLRPGANGVHTLYVLHGGGPNSGVVPAVEVFEIKAASPKPTLTWIGCAPYPEGV